MATAMSPQQGSVMPKSHVGFDSITNQIERKLLKRGFQFNVICVGKYNIPNDSKTGSDTRYRSDRLGEIDLNKHYIRITSH